MSKFSDNLSRAILLIFSSAVFLAFLFVAGLGFCRELEKTKDAIVGYLKAQTKNEQVEHLVEIKKILSDVEDSFVLLEDHLSVLESSDELGLEQKKEFLLKLRMVEENAILLEDQFREYFSDNSIQYSPYADEEITSFVYESRNFGIVLQRFVRQEELVLLVAQNPSKEQRELLMEQYYEVDWYMEKLEIRN